MFGLDLSFLAGYRRYLVAAIGIASGVYAVITGAPLTEMEWTDITKAFVDFAVAGLALSSKFRSDETV